MASGLCAALTGRTHGCTDQPASVKKTLANSEPSTHGRFCCRSRRRRERSLAPSYKLSLPLARESGAWGLP
jgi:hypothetical protein